MQAPQGAAQVGPQGAAHAGAQAAAGAAQAGAQAGAGAQQLLTGAQQLLLRLKHPPSLPQRFRMLLHHPEILLLRLTLQHLTGAQQSTGAGAHAAGAAQAGAQAAAGAAQAGAQAGAQAAAGAAQAGAQALPLGAAQVGPHAFAQGAAHGAAQLGAASQQVGAGAQHPPRPNRPASAILTLEAISRAAAKVVHFILKSPRHRPGVFGLRIPTTRTYCPGFEGLHHSP